MRLPACVFSVLLLLACPAVASAALPKVLTQDSSERFAVRPAAIGYTGDATAILGGSNGSGPRRPGRLRWTRYTPREGVAKGMNWINDCEPSCAEGDFSSVPVTVHVFSPKRGRFTRLTMKFTYDGDEITDRRRLRHTGSGRSGYWYYEILSMG
jgi:hypothetical protein